MVLRILLIICLKNVKFTMINKYKKIVIKIGSSSIVNPTTKKKESPRPFTELKPATFQDQKPQINYSRQ